MEMTTMRRTSGIGPLWTKCMIRSLAGFHGKRFVVVLTSGNSRLALRGRARYTDDDEGNLLRIEVDDEAEPEQGNPVFVIRENRWDSRIVVDGEFGCEYQLRLSADAVQHCN